MSEPRHDRAQAHFLAVADAVQGALQGEERFLASLIGEHTDFVRINRGRIRQPGSVQQSTLTLRLVEGRRHASAELTLSGAPDEDRARALGAVAQLREVLPSLPDDPHLLLCEEQTETTDVGPRALPPGADIVEAALSAAGEAVDLVGVYAGGEVTRAFASSTGQREWFSRSSFTLDWCLVHSADKAVKSTVAGATFDERALQARMDEARAQLSVLARPAKKLSPGGYRAWLSPAAVGEVMGLLSWGAFSARSLAARTSPWSRLEAGEARLDPRVRITEDNAGGVAPRFQAEGFRQPAAVPLIDGGALVGRLVSPRSALEYGLPQNGANANEQPGSLAMAPGELPSAEALRALGTGVWVGNLWYLNWTDRSVGRFTGMTRFASFWVEGGEIVAPIDVMRFDDTLYRWLGSELIALGAEAPLQLSTDTYFNRSTDSLRLPGLLIGDLRFTL